MIALWLACEAPEQPTATDGPSEPQTLAERCFPGIGNAEAGVPDYDAFDPVVTNCSGTDHQEIEGIEKVVFLGDSVTAGTWPTLEHEYYRAVLESELEERFGPLDSANCSAYGARTDDLLLPPHEQIRACFPVPEEKRTLVVMTVGGNDMFAVAEEAKAGATEEELSAMIDLAISDFRDAIVAFDDAAAFPGGVYVLYSNVYEYTDATGDMGSCPAAEILGFEGQASSIRDGYVRINEAYVQIAVETQRDVIFALETFCGHGFYNEDPANECYRGGGEASERWFDNTCLHPTPEGHAKLAEMFLDVVVD